MTTKIIRDGEGDEHAEPLKVEAFKEGQGVAAHAEDRSTGGSVVGAPGMVEREAYELGFKAGERAGFAIGAQKATVTAQALARLLAEIGRFRNEIYGSAEKELATLAIAIARKVIGREVEISDDVVRGFARDAIDALTGEREIIIRMNPKDMETIKQYRAEILENGAAKSVRLRSDESISRGGCIVETNFQEAEATIEGCLRAIEERLKDERK